MKLPITIKAKDMLTIALLAGTYGYKLGFDTTICENIADAMRNLTRFEDTDIIIDEKPF